MKKCFRFASDIGEILILNFKKDVMKKIILAVSIALLSTGAFAQGGFQWGVKAGLNLATITNVDDAKFRPGLNAGVFGEYVINEFVGIQAELLYSMQGYKFDGTSGKTTAKFDYINLPILAKLYVLENLSVDLGPQFGYMVNEERGDMITPANYSAAKDFDVSFAMGASYKLNFGLDVFARYNLGLTKINETGKAKNSVIQVGVGYRF